MGPHTDVFHANSTVEEYYLMKFVLLTSLFLPCVEAYQIL